jgi:hypothetical protein
MLCRAKFFEDEDDDEDDLNKTEAQNTISIICLLSSVFFHVFSDPPSAEHLKPKT